MSQAMVTVSTPIAAERIEEAIALIRGLGNPAAASIALVLDELNGDNGIHFVSLHAIPPGDPRGLYGNLVLEFCADGDDDAAIARIVGRIGLGLQPVFALTRDWKGRDLAAFLKAHKVTIGHGWTGQTGLPFAGTPGMSVGRIRREAELALYLADRVGHQEQRGLGALARMEAIRAEIRAGDVYTWALQTPSSLPAIPSSTKLGLVAPIAISFIRTYLWPLAIPFAVVLGFGLWQAVQTISGIAAMDAILPDKGWLVVKALWSGLLWLLGAILAFAIPVLAALLALYASLRSKEGRDWLDDSGPRRDVLGKILENENHDAYAQNHMVSVTTLKPGLTRTITARLAFWIIGTLAGLNFKPGFLGDVGTIHFARWVTLPGTRQLVFFSNYGGSWESYLEDFITKAHNGLTAVWSNTVGFPRTENLFQKGATDGERFKRYARRSMLPTPFWYSAYPTLTTANIRANAAIRCGLAAAMTDEEAITWLALFGSAARPAAKLESNQIQSLVFGGLSFMPHGELLLIDFDDHMPAARGWLQEILPEIAFDDGRRLKRDAVLTLALGPGALGKAGLPTDAIESFPPAYLDGMTGPGRSRIIGDHPEDPETKWWWRPTGAYDAAVLVYGKSEGATAALSAKVADLTARYGHQLRHVIGLNPIPDKPADRLEPFGFVDGISQPVIRGTYRGLRHADPIHLVEPGEFILGYPDNRGNIPPGPTLRPLDDPDNRLPIRCDNTGGFASNLVDAPREIGRNGTFLVIRQLEQDKDAFWEYCRREAERLQGRLGEPVMMSDKFIGAKVVGRWPDGSSLVRNPYTAFSDSSEPEQHLTSRLGSNPATAPAIPPPPAANPDDNDFLFGTEDPEGLRCPYGAHIRRANPRDSLDPGSQDQIDISNRHRIIRVGRSYVAKPGQKDGLMFMCLNGDIERQFEFVQQTWLGSQTFHGLSGERDALAGAKDSAPGGLTIPTRDGPLRLAPMSRFVTPRGGGYFFLPGKRLLEFLSS